MKRSLLKASGLFLSSLFICLGTFNAAGQANIQVKVLTVQVLNNVDCDGFFSGNSDFAFEYAASDNTLGYTNNSPAAFGLTGDFNFSYQNGNNGPWTLNPNSVFFNHDYYCINDIPSQINIDWQAYENDDPIFNWDLTGAFSELRTNVISVNIAVPGAPGSSGPVTFTGSGSSGCGTQNYSITFEVIRTDIPGVLVMADDICDAQDVAINTTYGFAYCTVNTLEPNEPRAGDVASNNASGWVKFTAPASGEVEITTDLSGTEIGTYFQLYHAADGGVCGTGIQPITGTLIKDKFEYLSHIEFSDGIDLLGVDPEAQLSFDACDPIPLISYPKLIAGEVYYVQITADSPSESGLVQFRVNDLGGSSGSPDDIPCQSSNISFGTAFISNSNGDPASVTVDFGCAMDGGNDAGETGAPAPDNNAVNYHAYDYDHPSFNNNTMNESVWFNFTAPNQGRIVMEVDYDNFLYGENSALFGYDKRFAPGIPTDFSCANLEFLNAASGDMNTGFGTTESAVLMQPCLEPGYNYYGMMDPSDLVTPLSPQDIYAWVYDPSVVDPTLNPPGNDILCLTVLDPLYEVVVTPAGMTPPFQAVAGTNELACTEYLAGEPPAHPDSLLRANQTVWHYFTVPPSGAIEMNIRAYIGLDTLRYAVYELLNGTDCYGGLNPATFTDDGTQNTPIITPVLQGTAGFEGTQESICCMTPGAIYAVQLDGGYPGDEGQYIIEYIREVASYAGDTYVELANADIIDFSSGDTAFVCFGDNLIPGNMLDGNGDPTLDIPSCLTPGFVMHSTLPIPDPVSGSGFTYIDTVQGTSGVFVNNSDGSGSFGNPTYNNVYYVSSMADDPSAWGDFLCTTSTVDNFVPVVYLQPLTPVYSYDNNLCEITFTATGGMSGFNGSDFTYTIEDGSMNLVATGTFAAGVDVIYPVPSAEIFTITIDDGACPYVFTVDATACANPCVVSPINLFVNTTICEGDSIYLEGAYQTVPGLYTDVFIAANGCDSTIFTTLDFNVPAEFEQTLTICEGSSYSIGTNTYDVPGVYSDTLIAANGCDSIVTTNLFIEPILGSSYSITLCQGQSYTFDGNVLTTSGTYADTLPAVAGCDSIVTLYLFVNPQITNSIGATICQGGTYTLGSQTLTTSGEYSEMFTTSTGCDSLVTVFLSVDVIDTTITAEICEPDTYTLGTQPLTTTGIYSEMFTTSAGCDSLVTLELTVLDCGDFIISNICTPNDDGSNDTWKVSDPSMIAGCKTQIFNRWGQLMFESDNYNNTWDGTKDGSVLPDGVYYYSIGCDSETQYQGVINLMRFQK